jgi:hypothetical protein
MQAARARGGRNKAKAGPADPTAPQQPDLRTGPAIIATLDRAAKAMADGSMSVNAASALAALGRLALQVLKEDQAEQIAQLAAKVKAMQPQTHGRRR